MACPFVLLGVEHDADERAARKAHRALMLGGAHPDKGGSLAHAQALGEAVSLIADGKGFRRCDCRSTRTARPGASSFAGSWTDAPEFHRRPWETADEWFERIRRTADAQAAARARAADHKAREAEDRRRRDRERQERQNARPTRSTSWNRPAAADGQHATGATPPSDWHPPGRPIHHPGATRPPKAVRDMFERAAPKKAPDEDDDIPF